MDKITLENTRDLPMTTNTLAFMQAAYAAMEKLGYIGGDNYIVSGCAVTGSSAAPGYMFLKGILMPFIGGTITTNVKIVKEVKSISVDAGVREQTSYRAEFGASVNTDENVAWSDIVRTDTIISLMSQMTVLNNRLKDAEDDILINAQDIQGLDDRIVALELDEIPWTDVSIIWGGLQGNTVASACKIGKVIYIEGIVNADYNPGADTILFQLPSSFPLFIKDVKFSSSGAGENGQLKALGGSRNIVSGSSVNADSDQYFSVSIPLI